MSDPRDVLRQYVEDLHAAIESACEASLATLDCGVLVTYHPDGGWTVEVSHQVPYGNIYEVKGSGS